MSASVYVPLEILRNLPYLEKKGYRSQKTQTRQMVIPCWIWDNAHRDWGEVLSQKRRELVMNTSCHIPLEVLRKLPYEYRVPMNDEDDLELFREDVSDVCDIWKFRDTVID